MCCTSTASHHFIEKKNAKFSEKFANFFFLVLFCRHLAFLRILSGNLAAAFYCQHQCFRNCSKHVAGCTLCELPCSNRPNSLCVLSNKGEQFTFCSSTIKKIIAGLKIAFLIFDLTVMLRQGQQTRTNESERDFISSKNDKMASVAGPIDMVKNNNIVSI